jgi:ParB family chromosome partitioning protein
LTVNGVCEAWNRRPRALAHADRLAGAVGLDMAALGWTATAGAYLGRVTKARILAAVREAKGEDAARQIEPLKKPEMVEQAEALLAGSGWLPEVLRTAQPPQAAIEETAAVASEPAIDPQPAPTETSEHSPAPAAFAAE